MGSEGESWAIVGAGPSGLAMGRAFSLAGIPFAGYERHSDVGGIWDIDNPGTPMYESAHFISSRTLSALAGLPFPEMYPDYPSRVQLLRYLGSYADHFGLRPSFRFGCAVRTARRDGACWRLTLDDGTEAVHRGLVLATGSQWLARVPEYPGAWSGEALHSSQYKRTDQFRGKRVLIVGAGNSGCDIACDAVSSAASVSISLRRGYRFVPKHIFGVPADVFARRQPSIPGWLRQRIFDRLIDLLVGDVTRYGLPRPDHHVLATHPIMNTQILHHLAHGDLQVRPDIEALAGDRVRFKDGAVEPFDLIVWATGYKVSFPVLAEGEVVFRRDNEPDLFLNVFPRGRHDLALLGVIETDGGAWPLISLQAEAVAAAAQVPEPRRLALQALLQASPSLTGGIDHIDTPRHRYYLDWASYDRLLRRTIRRIQSL